MGYISVPFIRSHLDFFFISGARLLRKETLMDEQMYQKSVGNLNYVL